MKIATFNVNGVNGRLPVLIRWLAEAKPDIACLQELKASDDKFPEPAIQKAGYRAVWHGQKSWNGVAILVRDRTPMETRRGLPGDSDDAHSRYIEAAVDGVLIGCLYVPNGNPAPGPKLDYKLRWFDRLAAHAAELIATGMPVVLAGDFNVMPTELDVYKPERWLDDALFRPEVRDAFHCLLAQGWTDAVRALHSGERIYTFWDYFRNAWARNAGLRIDHLLLSPSIVDRLVAADVDRQVRGWEKASDHAPTWVELGDPRWNRTQRRGRPMTGVWEGWRMTDTGEIVVEPDLMVPARDGVLMATDVYRPGGPGPFPVLLERTPYDKSVPSRAERTAAIARPRSRAEVAAYFIGHGYAVAYQDCRGRYHSGGHFTKYLSEAEDGFDTLVWLQRQPWCNGRVGTFGLSYAAHTQAALGCLDPPGLAAQFLDCGGFSNAYRSGIRHGGAFDLKQATWAYRNALADARDPASEGRAGSAGHPRLVSPHALA